MPYSKSLRLGFACLAAIASLALVPAAHGASATADLRVVTTSGMTLAEQSQVTGDVTIKTDPGADCFGPGHPSSGSTYQVPGPTALGIVRDASETNGGLRPLSVTDGFFSDGFGLGLCGVAGYAFHSGDSGYWYFKVNHSGSTVSGSQHMIKTGDEVLWYQSPGTFPPPSELELVAPPIAQSGRPFAVRVFSYDDSGQRSPAVGARVTGADLPTAGDGQTTVLLAHSQVLDAVHDPDIPSNHEIVCLLSSGDTCGLLRRRVVGTNRADRIRGSEGPDLIRSRGGDDRVNIRGGLPDVVNCGRGVDKAIIGFNDVARRCEKVIRKG
jgi:hypothetical protein